MENTNQNLEHLTPDASARDGSFPTTLTRPAATLSRSRERGDERRGSEQTGGQPTGEQMLTKADVARYCQVTSRCIDNWMARGILAYFKMGRTVRFRLGDVQDHLTKNCRVCRRSS